MKKREIVPKWSFLGDVERAAYAHGLRAAARRGRRMRKAALGIIADQPTWTQTVRRGRALGYQQLARWCDRRAAAVLRGER